MITLFNRKELCTTYDAIRQNQVRDILAANHIDYKIRLYDPARTASRSCSHGTIGLNPDHGTQYYIYVKKEDYEKATYLLHQQK